MDVATGTKYRVPSEKESPYIVILLSAPFPGIHEFAVLVGVAIGTRKNIPDETNATAIVVLLSAQTIEITAECGVLGLISHRLHRCHMEANIQPMAVKGRYRTYPMTFQKLITKF